MDPATIGAIASVGSQLFSASQAKKGQSGANSDQMAFNAAEAQKQRDWESHMFNHRYQYTRKDLEAAGYNPLMALGLNPSVPSGASASATPQSTTKDAAAMTSQSALNAANVVKTLSESKYIQAQTDKAKGTFSVPGFFSGPWSAVQGSISDYIKKNSSNAKGAAQALKNFLARGSFGDA